MLQYNLKYVNFADAFCRASKPPVNTKDSRLSIFDCHLTLQVNTKGQFDIDLLVQNIKKIHCSFISTDTFNTRDSGVKTL